MSETIPATLPWEILGDEARQALGELGVREGPYGVAFEKPLDPGTMLSVGLFLADLVRDAQDVTGLDVFNDDHDAPEINLCRFLIGDWYLHNERYNGAEEAEVIATLVGSYIVTGTHDYIHEFFARIRQEKAATATRQTQGETRRFTPAHGKPRRRKR